MKYDEHDEARDAAYYLGKTRGDIPAEDRVALSQAGLCAPGLNEELELLLIRNLHRGLLEQGDLPNALAQAQRMTALAVETGRLREVAHHDAARILSALGRHEEAIEQERLAAHTAVPSRKSFHLWSLATYQHFAGNTDDARATLKRGIELAQTDRLLLRAHLVHVELDAGLAPVDLVQVLDALGRTGRRGYERYLRGMIAFQLGDRRTARTCLSGWLEEKQNLDLAGRTTLKRELARATDTLRQIGEDRHGPGTIRSQ